MGAVCSAYFGRLQLAIGNGAAERQGGMALAKTPSSNGTTSSSVRLRRRDICGGWRNCYDVTRAMMIHDGWMNGGGGKHVGVSE